MVRRLIRGMLSAWNITVLCTFLALFAAAEYYYGNAFVATVVNGLYMAMAVIVGIVYGPTMVDYIRENKRIHYLATGVFTLFTAIGVSRIWAAAYLYMGRPVWMTDHWFPTLCYLIAASTGFFFLRAPDNLPNHQFKSWRYLTAAMILAVFVTATVIFIGANIE